MKLRDSTMKHESLKEAQAKIYAMCYWDPLPVKYICPPSSQKMGALDGALKYWQFFGGGFSISFRFYYNFTLYYVIVYGG